MTVQRSSGPRPGIEWGRSVVYRMRWGLIVKSAILDPTFGVCPYVRVVPTEPLLTFGPALQLLGTSYAEVLKSVRTQSLCALERPPAGALLTPIHWSATPIHGNELFGVLVFASEWRKEASEWFRKNVIAPKRPEFVVQLNALFTYEVKNRLERTDSSEGSARAGVASGAF